MTTKVWYCPSGKHRLEMVDGRKIGGIPGNKYRVCIICNFAKAVKHHKFSPEARRLSR